MYPQVAPVELGDQRGQPVDPQDLGGHDLDTAVVADLHRVQGRVVGAESASRASQYPSSQNAW